MVPQYSIRNLLFCLCLFGAGCSAQAESFTVIPVQFDQGWNLIGIESTGAVIVLDSYNLKYETFFDGALVSESPSAPSTLDNGTPCLPSTPGGFTVSAGRCNGAFQALDGWNFGVNPNQHTPELFSGLGAPSTFVASGGGGLLFLNSAGALAWDDAFSDTIFEAVPQNAAVTPEPASLLLLATGGGVALVAMRRRKHAGPDAFRTDL